MQSLNPSSARRSSSDSAAYSCHVRLATSKSQSLKTRLGGKGNKMERTQGPKSRGPVFLLGCGSGGRCRSELCLSSSAGFRERDETGCFGHETALLGSVQHTGLKSGKKRRRGETYHPDQGPLRGKRRGRECGNGLPLPVKCALTAVTAFEKRRWKPLVAEWERVRCRVMP